MCRQEQQNLSTAKRDNHLLTPSLYLRCHERKSWKLTLAAVSICFHHLHSTNKTQQWIFSLDLSTTVLPMALTHFTNQRPSKKKPRTGDIFQFVCLPDSQQPCLMHIWLVFNECSNTLKQLMKWHHHIVIFIYSQLKQVTLLAVLFKSTRWPKLSVSSSRAFFRQAANFFGAYLTRISTFSVWTAVITALKGINPMQTTFSDVYYPAKATED